MQRVAATIAVKKLYLPVSFKKNLLTRKTWRSIKSEHFSRYCKYGGNSKKTPGLRLLCLYFQMGKPTQRLGNRAYAACLALIQCSGKAHGRHPAKAPWLQQGQAGLLLRRRARAAPLPR